MDATMEEEPLTGDDGQQERESEEEEQHEQQEQQEEQEEERKGEMMRLEEECYVSGSGDTLIFFFPDGSGLSAQNQRVADQLGQAGYVVMPDLLQGDTHATPPLHILQQADEPLIQKVKDVAVAGFGRFGMEMWLARHTDEKTVPIMQRVVQAAKERFTPRHTLVAGVGFGGNMALVLAGGDGVEACAVVKPMLTGRATLDALRKPTLLLHNPLDPFFGPQDVEYAREHATVKEMDEETSFVEEMLNYFQSL